MPMPSDTEMVVNSRGVPPAASMPCLAASACGPCVMLQGVVSPFIDTTPIIGLWIAASSSPIARMKARCGVRSRPSRVMDERRRIRSLLGSAPNVSVIARSGNQFWSGSPPSRGGGDERSVAMPADACIGLCIDGGEIGLDVEQRRVVEAVDISAS